MSILDQIKSKLKESAAAAAAPKAAAGETKKLSLTLSRYRGENSVILYHKSCMDGFCSAWIAHKVLPDAKFIPVQYNEPVPDGLEGKEVYILDFSFKEEVLCKIAESAKKVVVLDHHLSAKKDLEDKRWPKNCEVHFDMEKSGARLTQQYFNVDNSFFIDYTEDRDLWRFSLKNSKEINAWLRGQKMDFDWWDTWDKLSKRTPLFLENIIDKGEAILNQLLIYIESHVEKATDIKIIKGFNSVTGLAVNVTVGDIISEIGERLAQKSGTFGATYFVTCNKVIFSLRSRGDFDVSALAKNFGGGGHKNAAGFSISFEKFFAYLNTGVLEIRDDI